MSKHALCVGINDYPGSDSDLQGCVNDANDWGQALSERGFGVTTMLNGDATKQNIVHELKVLLAQAKSNDTVAFTYSGHGTWIPDADGDEADGRDEALCPWDCITTGEVLSDDELYNLFVGFRKRGVRLVFISDSCHSGSVNRFMPPLNFVTMGWYHKAKFLAPELILRGDEARATAKAVQNIKATSKSRYSSLLISGCKDTEYSYDAVFDGRANGAFTYAALQALKKNDALWPQGYTYSAWYQSIRLLLPSQDYPQTPLLSGSSDWKKWTPVL